MILWVYVKAWGPIRGFNIKNVWLDIWEDLVKLWSFLFFSWFLFIYLFNLIFLLLLQTMDVFFIHFHILIFFLSLQLPSYLVLACLGLFGIDVLNP
jgi:hypothetical protein